jgi:hypothetical protein
MHKRCQWWIGAMLCQADEEGVEQVIAFASRQLLKPEKNYTPFLVEVQSIILTLI